MTNAKAQHTTHHNHTPHTTHHNAFACACANTFSRTPTAYRQHAHSEQCAQHQCQNSTHTTHHNAFAFACAWANTFSPTPTAYILHSLVVSKGGVDKIGGLSVVIIKTSSKEVIVQKAQGVIIGGKAVVRQQFVLTSSSIDGVPTYNTRKQLQSNLTPNTTEYRNIGWYGTTKKRN